MARIVKQLKAPPIGIQQALIRSGINAIRFGRRPHCSMLIPSTDSGSAMGLAWFGRLKVSVRVLGPDIIVTMPGTSFSVMYTKTEDNKLVANGFSARKLENEKRRLPSFPCTGVDSG